jgi:hypothetical protein
MSIESLYTNYYSIVTDTVNKVKKGDPFDNFKSNKYYIDILEHVNPELASNLLTHCRNEFNLSDEDMEVFISENNKIGMPIKTDIVGWTHSRASPSNFRYIYHAHLILSHLSKLNILDVDIVELGGGYGGLSLALSIYATKFNIRIHKYHYIDLPNVALLQEVYIKQYNPSFSVESHSADTFGSNIIPSDKPLYLVSCYAFTEIDKQLRKNYLYTLFPKIQHGFIINNGRDSISITELNRNVFSERERPYDHNQNTFWYF